MILNDPTQNLSYFIVEYSINFAFNFITALSTIIFLLSESSGSDTDFKYWLRLGYTLNICSLFPKLLMLLKVYKIPVQNESLIVRRLMMLIRSNVFSWNVKLTYVLYVYYIVMLGKLATTNTCANMNNTSYRFCHFIIYSFLLRLLNSFSRFLGEYYFSGHNSDNSAIRGARQEEIDGIPVESFTEEMENVNISDQLCGICLQNFIPGQEIKRLPCSEKHFFHKYCTDIWLKKRNICPYCRRELSFLEDYK